MQTLPRRHMIVIKDYDHMKTMHEKFEVDETTTFIIKKIIKP